MRTGTLRNIGDKEMNDMREKLRKARIEKNMTQKQVAEYLHIAERYYKQIEYGERLGAIEIWDSLEDLFNVHQRILREISENRLGKVDNQ